jgi:AcrR family transcriptional regulator
MTRLTVEAGYEQTTIRRLLTEAHVARATFYRQFADKRECLLCAQRDGARQLLRAVREHSDGPWAALVAFAAEHPHTVRLLADIPEFGDQQVLAEHHRCRGELAGLIGALDDLLSGPPTAVLGAAAMRVLGEQATQPESNPAWLVRQIAEWVSAYRTVQLPTAAQPPNPAAAGLVADSALSSATLERGEPLAGVGPRILRALLHQTSDGDAMLTVGDLAASAGVSREAFYGHFADRAAAVNRLRQIIFGDVIALCMRAFTRAESWPEQVSNVAHALAGFYDSHPRIARFVLLGPLHPGPGESGDCLEAFAMFIEPGLVELPATDSRLSVRLIAAAVFELLYQSVEEGHPCQTRVGWLTFLVLAPSLGATQTIQFLDRA